VLLVLSLLAPLLNFDKILRLPKVIKFFHFEYHGKRLVNKIPDFIIDTIVLFLICKKYLIVLSH
jgi:hypothetical protein